MADHSFSHPVCAHEESAHLSTLCACGKISICNSSDHLASAAAHRTEAVEQELDPRQRMTVVIASETVPLTHPSWKMAGYRLEDGVEERTATRARGAPRHEPLLREAGPSVGGGAEGQLETLLHCLCNVIEAFGFAYG